MDCILIFISLYVIKLAWTVVKFFICDHNNQIEVSLVGKTERNFH